MNFRCLLSIFVLFTFILTAAVPVQAQAVTELNLPKPGTMVFISEPFTPALIKGLTIHPQNPLQFDFIVDTGDAQISGKELEDESAKLIKYFLASLTVPEKELWVNLSPYEKDRIVPESLGATAMGRDMLAQDYLLKQLTASLIYPEKDLGKSFWSKAYAIAKEKYGTTDIALNTFNKVWIIPQKATVYEHNGSAFVVNSHLSVMLDQDYLAMQKNTKVKATGGAEQAIREVILPELEKEINTGKNFANVRQIYNSMILAIWYKQNLKQTLLNQVYADQGKTKGIDLQDKTFKQKIYNDYLVAFKKGAYNYIKEEIDPVTQRALAKKYFSGGLVTPTQVTDLAVLSPEDARQLGDLKNVRTVSIELDGIKDPASPATDLEYKEAPQRLQEIRAAKEYTRVYGDKNLPATAQQLLVFYDGLSFEELAHEDFQAFYDSKNNDYNPIRAIIRSGELSQGLDEQQIVNAQKDDEGYFISTHERNKASEELVRLLTPNFVEKFLAWQGETRRSTGIGQIAPFQSGTIVSSVQAAQKYEIFDLFQRRGTITVEQILEHIKTLSYYSNPSSFQIHEDLTIFVMLGWITRKVEDDINDRTEYTITNEGRQAFQWTKLYGQVVDAVPDFHRLMDVLLNRDNAPQPKPGALSLQDLVALSERGWDLPNDIHPNVRQVIDYQLTGYLYWNFVLSMLEDAEFSKGDIDIDLLKSDLQNSQYADVNAVVLEQLGLSADRVNELTEEQAVKGFNRILKNLNPKSIPAQYKGLLPRQMQDFFENPQGIPYRNEIRLRRAILNAFYSRSILKIPGGLLNFFDDNSKLSIERIKQMKYIEGEPTLLKAALDFLASPRLRFLKKSESGDEYQMLPNSTYAFPSALNYGVTTSYRSTVDRTEEVVYNSLILSELDGVDRDLNVRASGFTHGAYFEDTIKMIDAQIVKDIASGRIPSPEVLKARPHHGKFRWLIAGIGEGDGTFASHIIHYVETKTPYAKLMRDNPGLYETAIVGTDFHQIPQDIMRARFEREGIDHIVMKGDIGDMVETRKQIAAAVAERFPDSENLITYESSSLIHNRPGKLTPEGQPLLSSGKFEPTHVYAFGGKMITAKQFEDNLIRFFKSLFEPIELPEFVREGSQYHIDLYAPVAEETSDQVINEGDMRALQGVGYLWTHSKSYQHMTSRKNSLAAREAARVKTVNPKVYPRGNENAINVEVMQLEPVGDPAMAGKSSEIVRSDIQGGINFDPAMMDLQIKRDKNGMPLPFSQQPIRNITIDGLYLRITKITDANVPALLGLEALPR